MLEIVREEAEKLTAEWRDRRTLLEHHGADQAAQTYHQVLIDVHHLVDAIEARLGAMTVSEYAAYIGVEPATVRVWIRTDQLPATKTAAGEWRIPYGAKRRKLRERAP